MMKTKQKTLNVEIKVTYYRWQPFLTPSWMTNTYIDWFTVMSKMKMNYK